MRNISILFLLFSYLNGFSQNLVPNPTFEQYSICPDNPDQLSRCQFWNSFRETPDYFNNCSSSIYATTPSSYNGFQYPHSGNAYTGFYIFVRTIASNREFIGAQLLSTFIIGQKYFISLHINLGGQNQSTIASNKMGVKFSTVPYSYTNPAPINNTAHFYSNSIIDDTVKWTRISGSFIADSAYNYIIIGNFFDDSHTDTINLATYNNYAYYFIDDVCITTDSLYNENWMGVEQSENESGSKEITINPNPASNRITISSINIEGIKQITISDLMGRQIYYKKQETNISETEIDISQLTAGSYFITTVTLSKKYTQKLIIVR